MNLYLMNPVVMTSEDRLREIASLLARGYLRSLSDYCLELDANDEPSCVRRVSGKEGEKATEVA